MERICEIDVDRQEALVHEHGWQSWSPTMSYRVHERSYRAASERERIMGSRAETPAGFFQGEGLLAIQSSSKGPVHIFSALGTAEVPSIRAELRGDRLHVSADGPVERSTDEAGGGIDSALARWADRFAGRAGVTSIRRAPAVWCSWYHYFTAVTPLDMLENLEAMDRLGLPVEVVQLDDGYQSAIGDWLSLSHGFRSLQELVRCIRATGRRMGIWVAPFLVGSRSDVAARHADWLVRRAGPPVDAGYNWEQDLFALDVTHPAVRAHLADVFSTMRGWGIDYFKIDFIYAGALPGERHEDLPAIEAYRSGMALIRESIGDDAYLLGCGAPILPSVGLVDAMRISPDTAPIAEPPASDLGKPSSRSAIVTGVGRAFQHARFWVNDPDCLIVRPQVVERERWAAHVERFGGLRASSDRLADLDDWGLDVTRRLLSRSPAAPFIPSG
jgi:alpha-galactosidase